MAVWDRRCWSYRSASSSGSPTSQPTRASRSTPRNLECGRGRTAAGCRGSHLRNAWWSDWESRLKLSKRLRLSFAPNGAATWDFWARRRVVRRLAETGDLNLFRAFPDSETAEIAVLHLINRRVLGLQVKTVDVDQARLRATVDVYASSFRPSPTTYFVVLGWLRDDARFHETCLLIPSEELFNFAHDDGRGHLEFEYHADATSQVGPDKYRIELGELRSRVTSTIEPGT